jgi:hypothetical protein
VGWGLRHNLTALRKAEALDDLAAHGVQAVWHQADGTLLDVIDDLDRQFAPPERGLRPLARSAELVPLLMTVHGVAGSCSGSRSPPRPAGSCASPGRVSWSGTRGLAPTVKQFGQGVHRPTIPGPNTLPLAAAEAAQHA